MKYWRIKMDIKLKAKQKVLDKLIEAMDDKMLGDLKGKSPKFAKVDIQSDDPKLAESIKDKIVDGIEDEDLMGKEKSCEPKEDEDDLERLKELYNKLK